MKLKQINDVILVLILIIIPVTPDLHARQRRSNFQCGKSFVPCNFPSKENDEKEFDFTVNKKNVADKDILVRQIFRAVDQSDVDSAAHNAVVTVDDVFNKTEKTFVRELNSQKFPSSLVMVNELFQIDKPAKDLSYSALLSISATQQIQRNGLTPEQSFFGLPEMPIVKSVLSERCPINQIRECIPGKYRTYSGNCNNVKKPLWGAVYEPLQRLQQPDYSDGVSQPRSGSTGHLLPSSRAVSRTLFTSQRPAHSICTFMIAAWAQFTYEDIARVGSNQMIADLKAMPIPCCAIVHPECYNIGTESDDPLFRNRDLCMPYSRSVVAPRENCSLGVREQGNQVSSFLDASHIYGSDKAEAASLRSFQKGFLKHQSQFGRLEILPAAKNNTTCMSLNARQQPCFASGSTWTNLLPTGAALHTIFLRQHNRIARQLNILNRHWNDEKLYQEARRIVGAQIQHITYNEFLPIIVGRENLRNLGLRLEHYSYSSNYNIDTNPATLNEFAAAVGLFFFTLLPDSLTLINSNLSPSVTRSFSSLYNDPSYLYYRDRLDGILRAMINSPIEKPGLHVSLEFREKFFKANDRLPIDMMALIIQMGRDHGLNGYNKWRHYCNLEKVSDFNELGSFFLNSVDIDSLGVMYSTVDDIDLFVGGLAEQPLHGALVGPTFACIIGQQFDKLRNGDRFWYENFFTPSAFTEDQLAEIKKTTFAEILCSNSDDIKQVQPNVFELPDKYGNCPMNCNTSIHEKINWNVWIDEEPEIKLPITEKTLQNALKLGLEQYKRLQAAEAGRIYEAQGNSPQDKASALSTHASLMAPKKESLNRALTAGILRETTSVLLRGEGLNDDEKLPAELDIATLQRMLPEIDVSRVIGNITYFVGSTKHRECLSQPLPCDHTTKYRTLSGWCNNLRFPHYGNAFSPLRRMLDPAYDDGFDSPRMRSKAGGELPSARHIANAVHTDEPVFHVKFSHMLMQVGQIIDHDMTHSPVARGPNNTILNCSRCDSFETLSVHCFPIRIPADDSHFPAFHNDGSPRCMPFARSLLGQVTLGYRNQLNQLTSYLDASYIYGSTECESNDLRLFSQGKLNFTNLGFNKQALPQGPQERDCRSKATHPCFNAGDERSNEQPGITVLHMLFLREHNRIATNLHKINNFWADEHLFQETRRIMIGKMQHIIYSEWLPIVLGFETMSRYDLTPRKNGYYKNYDNVCDASISQEFSTSAFRFGHTLIRNHFPRLSSTYVQNASAVDLGTNFNNVSAIYDKDHGHMESLLMGLLGAHGMNFDRHIAIAVRNHLFQKPGGPLTGLDLPAINIQRARDHGIPPYNDYRPLCGLKKATTFEDLLDTIDSSAVNALKSVYAHVDDIDLFPGIMSEKPLKGALVGPTLACLIAEQFQRLKRCDRFYYENNNPLTRFSPSQLAEIRKSTFSKLICENSDYARRIQPNAFLMPDELTNAPMRCNELPDIDLYEWLDRQFCMVNQRVINLGKTKRITPCITCTCTAEGAQCHSIVVENCADLTKDYLFSEIQQDTVCIIQCSNMLRRKNGRL